MRWARGPRASSVTEKVQRWLQQQRRYHRILLDEEFKASHTVSVIALVRSSATKAAVKNEQGQSLESNSERGIYWHCQNWKLKASSCQLDWGIERKTSRSPPRCQAFHKPPLHRCQLQGGVCPSPACDFASHWGLRSAQRVTQAYRGLQIHLHGDGTSCLSWHEGQAAWKWSISHRDRWVLGVIAPQLGVSGFGSPGMFLFTVIYNGAAHNFTPWNGALFCHVCKCKGKEGLPIQRWSEPWKFSSSNSIDRILRSCELSECHGLAWLRILGNGLNLVKMWKLLVGDGFMVGIERVHSDYKWQVRDV